MALELSGMVSKDAEDAARKALIKVGLEDRMEHIPDQLSGGQEIAPSFLLMSRQAIWILQVVKKSYNYSKTFVMTKQIQFQY